MAKKDFTLSPLMNILNQPAKTPQEAPAEAAEGQESAAAINDTTAPEAEPKAPETAQQTGTPGADQAEAEKTTRKDHYRTPKKNARIAEHNARFKSAPQTPPEYFAKPNKEEPRSRRVQLLVRPSVYTSIREIAHWRLQSVNNLIEEILSDYLKTHDHRGETK